MTIKEYIKSLFFAEPEKEIELEPGDARFSEPEQSWLRVLNDVDRSKLRKTLNQIYDTHELNIELINLSGKCMRREITLEEAAETAERLQKSYPL